ncbi:MAG: ABC transporter ATP-binding protein [Acidobacteria bacterium]|nr:MAG: ABC transporter ATP-binding protein [Acidobacteriota bacterium]
MSDWVIETRQLSKTFVSGRWHKRHVEAVVDVDLRVGRGEIFAFLGPNGAGKTTTINLLMGFLFPTRGAIRLFGLPPEDHRVRQRIGYLPEQYAYYSFLTAPQLLNFFGRLFRIPREMRQERIERLLRRFGLWEARHKKIGAYSRGMRQRLGLVQALLNDPELLILDEPTSGFDPLGRRRVRDILLDVKRRGVTIFLSSHILSEVELICDRVAIIHRGRIIKQGVLADIVGAHGGYEIAFIDSHGAVTARLKEMNVQVRSDGDACRTFTADESLAQAIVDAIRTHGGRLKAFVPRTRTLEEVFLELVGASAQTGLDSREGGEQ